MGKTNIGSSNLSKAYIGTDEIQKIYFGNDLVYSAYTPEHYLKFTSPNSFTLKTSNTSKQWNGTMEYSTNDGNSWNTWTGSSITAGLVNGNYAIYLRGTGNTYVTGGSSISRYWNVSNFYNNVSCTGNIEYLLDYATVAQGNHPPMANYCFARLFLSNRALKTAPEFPATTLVQYCYYETFYGCWRLENLPLLPATSLSFSYCYCGMFYNCSRIGLYTTNQANTEIYRIPSSGTGSGGSNVNAFKNMFSFIGSYPWLDFTPSINTNYYLSTIPLAIHPYDFGGNATSGIIYWQSNETNATYEIYRSSSQNGTYTKIGTTSSTNYSISSSYVNYYFKVRTTRSGYRDSEFTQPLKYLYQLQDPVLSIDSDSRPDVLIENLNSVSVTCFVAVGHSGNIVESFALGAGENTWWTYDGLVWGDMVYVWFSASGYADSSIVDIYVEEP